MKLRIKNMKNSYLRIMAAVCLAAVVWGNKAEAGVRVSLAFGSARMHYVDSCRMNRSFCRHHMRRDKCVARHRLERHRRMEAWRCRERELARQRAMRGRVRSAGGGHCRHF